MKRLVPIMIVLALLVCVGCGQDYRAKKMVQVDTTEGKMDLMWSGSPDHLVDRGVINLHRPYEISGEGVTIDVWVILASPDVTSLAGGKSRGTVLLIHGFRQSKSSMMTLASQLSDTGYDVVLPDLRRHGRSTGDYFTYGAKEKTDLAAILDKLIEDGTVDERLYVYGRRLGGSVAIQFAAIHPKCLGVVALLPHAGPASVLADDPDFWTLSSTQMQATLAAGAKLADFELTEADTILAARRLKCPLMILYRSNPMKPQAENDSKAIFEAAGSAKVLEPIDTADYMFQPDTYVAERIDAFISQRIPGMTD